jgi:hypothetical protein
MHDPANELRRISLLRRWVNRSRYANLSYIPLAIFVYALSYIFYAVDRLCFEWELPTQRLGPCDEKIFGIWPRFTLYSSPIHRAVLIVKVIDGGRG